ncbi:MAG: response regulator [Chloroflexi bacterium]|nr:response regulator [Chloroflexota bacterium]MBP7042502.1 response regulator [Chloroflexota bacterium]
MEVNKFNAHILIVDDNRLNRIKLARVLQQQGFQTTEAENGRLALECLGNGRYDLMLLDIVMPELNGFQVLEAMQQNKKIMTLPVIVISAQDEIDNAVRCIEMGAEDYLIKPFNPVLLNARLSAALEKKRLRDQEYAFLEQIQVERQRLEAYTQELQARNQELDAFAHTVAHDLKNPLAAIIGYVELLQKYYSDNLDDRGLKNLDRILQSGLKMNVIIDELLLLAGIRQQTVDPQPLNMYDIVCESYRRLSFLIENSQAEIVYPTDWPTAVGHAPWIEEVWANYISNGIKYGGRPPHLELGSTLQPDHMIRFWIRDNGSGIAPNDMKRLFVPFERLKPKKIEGFGLGLSVVERIIKRLGGSVGVESQSGQGSTFYFTLPPATVPPDAPLPPA